MQLLKRAIIFQGQKTERKTAPKKFVLKVWTPNRVLGAMLSFREELIKVCPGSWYKKNEFSGVYVYLGAQNQKPSSHLWCSHVLFNSLIFYIQSFSKLVGSTSSINFHSINISNPLSLVTRRLKTASLILLLSFLIHPPYNHHSIFKNINSRHLIPLFKYLHWPLIALAKQAIVHHMAQSPAWSFSLIHLQLCP